jgi:phosphatidylethanolamine/phosphatidyl-N-methylethanolamine N-methyltransferase
MSYRLFATEALTSPSIASVVPSSRELARAMLPARELRQARFVVEFGPGTGAITRELLRVLPSNASLAAFEINARFCNFLRGNLNDDRLVLFNASAEAVGPTLRELDWQRVDAVVSSLGLSVMEDRTRRAILRGLVPFLDEKSLFTQYYYLSSRLADDLYRRWKPGWVSVPRLLEEYFQHIESKIIFRNVPPAFVFLCRK